MTLLKNVEKISKLLAAKQWGDASEIFSQFSYPLRVDFHEERLSTPHNGLHWILLKRDASAFIFNCLISSDRYQFFITRLILLLPLLQEFHASKYFSVGELFINLDDSAGSAGLAFCSNREDSILIPDTDFLSTYGYHQSNLDFIANSPHWKMRKQLAFWRGTTTGRRVGESWRNLPRLRLCELADQSDNQYLFDVGISSFAQLSKKEVEEIKVAGYERNFLPISASAHFKYQIDIDGNSNAWAGLFQKLLSESVVLKVASPHNFRQWYYDQLIPWVNFVPIKTDMSDLVEKIEWLINHDDEAIEIGVRGKKIASKLTYDAELKKALINIHEALR